jgi:biopolymer transport protein ExbB
MKAIILCIIIVFVFQSRAAMFGESKKNKAQKQIALRADYYRQKIKTLQKIVDQAEADRWQKRYGWGDYRKSTEESLRQMEEETNRLLNKKNVLEERVYREEQRLIELKGEVEEQENVIASFRNLVSGKVDQLRDQTGASFPYGIDERIKALNQISYNLGAGTNLRQNVKAVLQFRINTLALAGSASIEDSRITDEEGAEPAYAIRLGTVYYAKASKVSDKAGMILHTGRIKSQVYQYHDQLLPDLKQRISKSIKEIALQKSDHVFLPFDVLQSAAVVRQFSQNAVESRFERFVLFLRSGGIMMIPLLLLLFWAVVIVIERLNVYRKRNINASVLMKSIESQFSSGNLDKTNQIIQSSDSSLGRILKSVLESAKHNTNRTMAEKALEQAILEEVPGLEKRLSTLAVIGGAAPLLGLLGTVTGMIALFEVITVYGTNDPKLLAGGISEALITTQTGLVIAVPIMLLHNYLSNRLRKITGDLQTYSLKVMNKIWPEAQQSM